jgi:hypothetical protein
MKGGSILYFERAKVVVDDVPDQLVRVHAVDEDSGIRSKEIFLLPNFYGKRKIYVVEITCSLLFWRRNRNQHHLQEGLTSIPGNLDPRV